MSRRDLLEVFNARTPTVAPSMLGCDFGNLHREVELLETAGAELLHLDVMDGHFVPNLTYGPVVIAGLRKLTRLPLDAHLMISDPARFLNDYLDAGCDGVTVHLEAFDTDTTALRDTLQKIRSADAVAGIAINPGTDTSQLDGLFDLADQVLVMSVEPGFGGQAFQPAALEKLKQLAITCDDATTLAVDGGIGPTTIAAASACGARVFVAGSAILKTDDYRSAIQSLQIIATQPQRGVCPSRMPRDAPTASNPSATAALPPKAARSTPRENSQGTGRRNAGLDGSAESDITGRILAIQRILE